MAIGIDRLRGGQVPPIGSRHLFSRKGYKQCCKGYIGKVLNSGISFYLHTFGDSPRCNTEGSRTGRQA
jgi:hypothetical protein